MLLPYRYCYYFCYDFWFGITNLINLLLIVISLFNSSFHVVNFIIIIYLWCNLDYSTHENQTFWFLTSSLVKKSVMFTSLVSFGGTPFFFVCFIQELKLPSSLQKIKPYWLLSYLNNLHRTSSYENDTHTHTSKCIDRSNVSMCYFFFSLPYRNTTLSKQMKH